MAETATFGELLRRHRHAVEMTIEELSSASGVSVRAIGDMERGRSRRPQHRTVKALAEALELTAHDHEELALAARLGRSHAVMRYSAVCELPRDVGDFTGRRRELAQLEDLAVQATHDGPPVIATISGGAGLGKTALVVHVAAVSSARFPDGCFFIDLQGMDDAPLSTGTALSRLLRAFGVSEDRIPEHEEERVGQYQALLSDRRSLIVLDNAVDESQVRPLLPVGGGSLTLVTSRRSLAGLEGVHQFPLEEMPSFDAVQMLRAIIGTPRGAEEDEELATLARLCGNLPLAMRIAGNRLLSRPGWTVEHLASQLADEGSRLGMLSAGDLHVDVAFAVSYRHLSVRARELFRRLALVPGPDSGVVMSAVLIETDLGEAEDALEELADLGLLQSPYPARYRLHDLVRLFARVRLDDEEPVDARQTATDRMNSWLLDVATTAGRWFEPDYGEPPADSAALVSLGTPEEAQAWLEIEGANWLAALRSVAADGLHSRVVEVAGAMHWFSDRWTHWGHWCEVFELSRNAARAMGDRRAEATHLNYLAWALDACEGRSQESVNCSLEAYGLAVEEGDLRQQGWALAYAASSALRMPGSSKRAAEYAREASELLAAAGDWDGYPQAVMLLGDCMHDLGRTDRAIELNAALLQTLRDPSYGASPNVRQLSTGLLLRRLGGNHAALGSWNEAAEHWREAIGFLRSQGIMAAASEAARGLGTALRELGQTAPAREAFEEALAGYMSVGDDESAAEVRKEITILDTPAPDRRSVPSDLRECS